MDKDLDTSSEHAKCEYSPNFPKDGGSPGHPKGNSVDNVGNGSRATHGPALPHACELRKRQTSKDTLDNMNLKQKQKNSHAPAEHQDTRRANCLSSGPRCCCHQGSDVTRTSGCWREANAFPVYSGGSLENLAHRSTFAYSHENCCQSRRLFATRAPTESACSSQRRKTFLKNHAGTITPETQTGLRWAEPKDESPFCPPAGKT